MKAVVATALGGPEVLQLQEHAEPEPGPGEVAVAVHAAGVNFMDTYLRRGLYSTVDPPFVPGVDGAGVITAVGAEVEHVRVGDRVAWKMVPGSYAQRHVLPAPWVVPVPDGVELDDAAAVLMQGMTAHVLCTTAVDLAPGAVALVHSAAGGTGRVLTQMLSRAGVRVIATVSRAEKTPAARAAGAQNVLVGAQKTDVTTAVRDLTGGHGVQAVFDGTGAEGFAASIGAVAYGGVYVLYGQAGTPVPPITLWDQPDGVRLMRARGDRPGTTPQEHVERGRTVLSWVADGTLAPLIGRRYHLADAAAAHRDIESRSTIGKLLLIP